jgi:hypothetical protein
MSNIIGEINLRENDEVIVTASDDTHTFIRVYWNGSRWFHSEGETMQDAELASSYPGVEGNDDDRHDETGE